MTFINEVITEETKGEFDFSRLTDPISGHPIAPRKRWTIDRDRNAVLIIIGGGTPEIPEFYALIWKGDIIKFSAISKVSSSPETGRIISWDIFDIDIPIPLQSKQEDICQLIREAIDAKGWLYDRDCLRNVIINIKLPTTH